MAKTAAKKRNSQRLPRDERMAEITTVTRRMLAEKGYENVVTTEIADAVGISEGTIFRYFPTKRDLLVNVAEAWFEEIISVPTEHMADHSPRERFRSEVGYALSIIRKEPALTRYVLMELRPDPAYRSMHIYQLNRRFTARILDALVAGVDGGELRKDVSPLLLRNMVFGCIEHQTWAFLRNEGDFSVDEVADAITTVVWRGMLREPVDAKLHRLEGSIDRLEGIIASLR